MVMAADMSASRRSRTESAGNHLETTLRRSVTFTHLFSAPLTELEMAKGGSGCLLPKPVPELSYEGERETLVRTLTNSHKIVRFMSEAANTASFARAVGCPNAPEVHRGGSRSSSISFARSGSDPSGGAVRRDRWDVRRAGWGRECRMLHFTGHGQRGKLTFEDSHGQLQYVDEAQLLAMLHCKPLPHAGASVNSRNQRGSRGRLAMQTRDCTPGRSARRAFNVAAKTAAMQQDVHAVGGGYAPFEEVSEMAELGVEEATAGRNLEQLGEFCSPSGLQLVFLSSCHSASLAHVFIEAVSACP